MPELIFQGLRVAYLDQGAGVPLVLLHAGGSSGRQWVRTAALLDDSFRVVAPDLWGWRTASLTTTKPCSSPESWRSWHWDRRISLDTLMEGQPPCGSCCEGRIS